MLPTLLLLACLPRQDTGTTPTSTDTDTPTDSPTGDSATTEPECLEAIDTGGSGYIDEACCFDEASVAVQGGVSEPQELHDGGPLPLSHSPQYGWELQLFPSACYTRDEVELGVVLLDIAAEGTLSEVSEPAVLYAEEKGTCCGETWLRIDRMDVKSIPDHQGKSLGEVLCDRQVRLTVTATDSDGRNDQQSLDLVFLADEEALGHPCGEPATQAR